MFTGIIEAIGHIAAIEESQGDKRFYIKTGKLDLSDVKIGDSIATNGVCLTAVELPGGGFWADVSQETLSKTSLAKIENGSPVNLEKALTPTTRLGGHLVSGHVDGLGKIVNIEPAARSWKVTIEAPKDIAKYIAQKGSICVDGTSLTVNDVNGFQFDLNIVPHTQQETIIQHYRVGSIVNLEVDVIARYLERMLMPEFSEDKVATGVGMETLLKSGFIK